MEAQGLESARCTHEAGTTLMGMGPSTKKSATQSHPSTRKKVAPVTLETVQDNKSMGKTTAPGYTQAEKTQLPMIPPWHPQGYVSAYATSSVDAQMLQMTSNPTSQPYGFYSGYAYNYGPGMTGSPIQPPQAQSYHPMSYNYGPGMTGSLIQPPQAQPYHPMSYNYGPGMTGSLIQPPQAQPYHPMSYNYGPGFVASSNVLPMYPPMRPNLPLHSQSSHSCAQGTMLHPQDNMETIRFYTQTPSMDSIRSFTQTPSMDNTQFFTPSPTMDSTKSFRPSPTMDSTKSFTPSPSMDRTKFFTPSPTMDSTQSFRPSPTMDSTKSFTPSPSMDTTTTIPQAGMQREHIREHAKQGVPQYSQSQNYAEFPKYKRKPIDPEKVKLGIYFDGKDTLKAICLLEELIYFERTYPYVSPEDMYLVFAKSLTNAAKSWATSWQIQESEGQIPSWEKCRPAFIKSFLPTCEVTWVKRDFFNLRQTGSIQEYNVAFLKHQHRYELLFPSLDTTQLRVKYITGLKYDLKSAAISLGALLLLELMTLTRDFASELEEAKLLQQLKANRYSNQSSHKSSTVRKRNTS